MCARVVLSDQQIAVVNRDTNSTKQFNAYFSVESLKRFSISTEISCIFQIVFDRIQNRAASNCDEQKSRSNNWLKLAVIFCIDRFW